MDITQRCKPERVIGLDFVKWGYAMMKKMICLAIAVLMCCSMVLPVMAEETEVFIPSVGGGIISVMLDGEDVTDSFGIHTVPDVEGGSTTVSEADGANFMDAYEALSTGEATLPVSGNFAYGDMINLTLLDTDNADAIKEKLAAGGKLTVALDPALEDLDGISVYVLVEGEWIPADDFTINPDGTITCVLQAYGPIVFVKPEGPSDEEEGDTSKETTTDNQVSSEFVPSITYKGAPLILAANSNATGEGSGDDIIKCLVTTSVQQARVAATDIIQDERDTLISLYERLLDGTMKLPLEKDHVIRDLVDLNFLHTACRESADHQKKIENLKKDGVTVTVKFALNIAENETVLVYVYTNDQWVPAENVTNNGDGTLTCTLEDVGPVAFVVSGNAPAATPWTGDVAGSNLGIWIGLMAVCAAGVVALIVFRKKLK